MVRVEDVDELIKLAESFLVEPMKMLGSNEFDRGRYYMLYELIDTLERMKENVDE